MVAAGPGDASVQKERQIKTIARESALAWPNSERTHEKYNEMECRSR